MILKKLIQNQVCFWDCILSNTLARQWAFWSSRSVWTPHSDVWSNFWVVICGARRVPVGPFQLRIYSPILRFYNSVIDGFSVTVYQNLFIISYPLVRFPQILTASQNTLIAKYSFKPKRARAAGLAQKRSCLGKLFRRAFRENGNSYLSRLLKSFLTRVPSPSPGWNLLKAFPHIRFPHIRLMMGILLRAEPTEFYLHLFL